VSSLQHLQQVILNIVNNAIQAMPEGGTLTIRTGVKRLNDGSGFVEVSFTDTGEGIPKENLGHIFEPFFSTRPKDKSAGVGLAISRDIIEHHGGVIVAESNGQGKGSTFHIGLPV
jgi:two-component system sensor histidine kinase AtoS